MLDLLKSGKFWLGAFAGAAATAFAVLAPIAIDSTNATIVVRNFSDAPLKSVNVTLSLGEQTATLSTIDVPVGETRRATFQPTDGSLAVSMSYDGKRIRHEFGYPSEDLYVVTINGRGELSAEIHPKAWIQMLGGS